MSDETKRACTTCVLCFREDYGYSNYTVEGTTLHCLAGLNPALDGQDENPWRDMTPELAAALDVALACPRYREGAPATLDVDHENIPFPVHENATLGNIMPAYTDDPVAAELLLARLTNPEAS